jgi:hypothetical protein
VFRLKTCGQAGSFHLHLSLDFLVLSLRTTLQFDRNFSIYGSVASKRVHPIQVSCCAIFAKFMGSVCFSLCNRATSSPWKNTAALICVFTLVEQRFFLWHCCS